MKSTTSMVTIADQLFSVLAKLRLNLKDKDVADRLGVSPGRPIFSKIFHYVTNVLYVRLKPLLIYPDKETVFKTLSKVFRKHFTNTHVIIDC